MTLDENAQQFIKFYYPEIKDLCKHFLTLISGTLVFSVAFSEKIVDFAKAPTAYRYGLVLMLFGLIIALGLCGLGLYKVFVAAEQAAGSVVLDYGGDFRQFARESYFWLDLAGITYGLSMVGMVALAILRILWPDAR